MRFMEQLLGDVFAAQGAPEPTQLARLACEALDRVGLVDAKRLALLDRDRKVRELKYQGMAIPAIAIRLHLDQSTIWRILQKPAGLA